MTQNGSIPESIKNQLIDCLGLSSDALRAIEDLMAECAVRLADDDAEELCMRYFAAKKLMANLKKVLE